MDTSTIIWIVVAVVVIGAIIAFLVSRSGTRREDASRAKAAEIREKAQEHDRRLRESEASAAEANARSEMARVEAQKRELEAERLATEAANRSEGASAVRRERDEQLRLADLRDPDVLTDKDGYRVDEQGNRLDRADGRLDDGDLRGSDRTGLDPRQETAAERRDDVDALPTARRRRRPPGRPHRRAHGHLRPPARRHLRGAPGPPHRRTLRRLRLPRLHVHSCTCGGGTCPPGPSEPTSKRGSRAQLKTTVRSPLSSTRDSQCHRTARASTRDSTSSPARTRSSGVIRWSTRTTSCSMIGPSSRSAVT